MQERAGTIRRVAAVAVVLLAFVASAGCGDSNDVDAGSAATTDGVDTAEADEVVATALNDVLFGGESFRSRTSGGVPFIGGGLAGTFEQSGEDVFEVNASGTIGSATVVVGGTAYEWNTFDQTWTETPVESFDPLIFPGFGLSLALISAFDATAEEVEPDGELPIATGWTEVDGTADGGRRFERTLPADTFTGDEGFSDDVPVERIEEAAVRAEFYDHAVLTAIVEVDRDGHLIRYTVRSEYDGSSEFPECGPLAGATGRQEQVVEFSDVGTDFAVIVPTPTELIAEYPFLADGSLHDSEAYEVDQDFRNESGDRDLSGCPTP